MRVKERFTQQMSKLKQSVEAYQEKWHQTGYENLHSDFDQMSDTEVGKRVKRNLRVMDQTDNMKRILNQQKHYKMLLVQDLLSKERKAKEVVDFRRSIIGGGSMNSVRNTYSTIGGIKS